MGRVDSREKVNISMTFLHLYNLITESDDMVAVNFNAEDAENYMERYDTALYNILDAFVRGDKRVPWRVIPAARLTKIWGDYGKMGFVRDIKGLNNIKEQMLSNIVKLDVCTALMGHTERRVQDMIDEADFEDRINLKDKATEERFYWDFFQTKNGLVIVSDYGLPKLQKLYPSINREENSERLLVFIDMALNVVHPRNDLASMFVEGGSRTLTNISEQ